MQVTPELIAWLESQRREGFDDQALFKALVNAGYTEAFASGLLSGATDALQTNAVQAQAHGGLHTGQSAVEVQAGAHARAQASVQFGAALVSNASAFPTAKIKAMSIGELAWFGQQSSVRAFDVDVKVLLQMKHPQLAVFEGLLSDTECDALIEQASAHLASSLTVDGQSGESVAHHARVSNGMFFQRGQSPLVALLEKRMSALLNFPENHGEGLQILNYKPGGKYDPHQDYFDPNHAGSHVHLKRGGQRIGTLICYLNTPASGGGTVFPDIGLTVSALRGRAVYFGYPLAHESSACLHGGNPVIEGEKWIATKWIREGVFQ